MKRKPWTPVLAVMSVSLICLPLLAEALGQGRARGRHYTKGDVERIIKRVETRSDSFEDTVDKHLDRSLLDGTRKEDNINEQVGELEKALDRLRNRFDRSDRWLEVRENVEDVISEAEDVNRIVRTRRMGPKIESEWRLLRADINTLAGVYNVRKLKV